ncbi:MAG: hypothetical protein CMM10_19070 [Rhodospirillaceae bacterium]|nr:hypothetical protein [Rhodospirillaceae bacterium]
MGPDVCIGPDVSIGSGVFTGRSRFLGEQAAEAEIRDLDIFQPAIVGE